MARFDRYMLSQLTIVFGFFSLVLVLVYWVNRAVLLFDQLIADGQSAAVFLELTLLSLPNVIRRMLPISAVAAAIYVTNRLSQDSELVVMQATGFGPFRLARPVLLFGLIVAALVGILMNWLVPLSMSALDERRGEIAESITARFLQEGEFLNPADGITVFIREVTPEGELQDVFLSDTSRADRQTTYSAQRSLLVRTETGPKLVMFDGMVQTLRVDARTLSVTRFEDLAYDLGDLLGTSTRTRRPDQLSTRELLTADAVLVEEVGRGRAELLVEGHERISQATLSLAAPLLGFATLLLGGYTRFGIWRQILAAVAVVIIVKAADTSFTGLAMSDARLWPLVYAGSLLALCLVAGTLWIAGRPFNLTLLRPGRRSS